MWLNLLIIFVINQVEPIPRMFAVLQEGNIRIKAFNTGGFGGPDRVNPWPRLEWPAGSGSEYLYEMGLLIGAKVYGYDPSTGDSLWFYIVDDGIIDGGDEDFTPISGFSNINNNTFAMLSSSTTWPSTWDDYLVIWGDTIENLSGEWAGEFGPGVNVGNDEFFYVSSDYWNFEFFPDSTTGYTYDPQTGYGGLGLMLYGRSYVLNFGDLADATIITYTVYNTSPKDIDSITLAWYIDVRIGGPGPDFNDDLYDYDTTLGYARFYDEDGIGLLPSGQTYPAGQLGLIFLQTPGIDDDNIDNDGDGMIDESPSDGIDNDNDWDPNTDDVGRDGIPGTSDPGEGNGIPDLGEPHFEWRDPDEIDEVGMGTAFWYPYGTLFPSMDDTLGHRLVGTYYTPPPEGAGDRIVILGTKPFKLASNEWTKFAFAIVMADGQDSATVFNKAMNVRDYYRTFLGIGVGIEETQTFTPATSPIKLITPVVKDEIRLLVSEVTSKLISISVVDITGRSVGELDLRTYGRQDILQVPVRKIFRYTPPNGMYFLRVKTREGFRTIGSFILIRNK